MKILLLNQTFYPDSVATAQQLTDFALRLVHEGHAVRVLTGRRGYDKREEVYPSRETYKGIDILRVGSTGLGKLTVFRRVIDSLTFDLALLWGLLWTPKQDLVVSLTSPPLVGFLGTIFCLLKGGKNAQWLMDMNPDAAIAVGYVRERSFAGRFLTWALEFSLRRADFVVVLDRWMKKRAEGHGARPENVVVVPPWPAHAVSLQGEDTSGREAFRRQHGLSGKFVLLYSGNHSVVHPLDTILGAALRMRERADVTFLFIGGGLRVPEVKTFKEKHGLENIQQLPHQPREVLPHSLASADAHFVVLGPRMSGIVHTSKVYGILATGKPYIAVTPAQSHLRDLVNECPGGITVGHEEVSELVEAIELLKGQASEERQRMAKINQTYVTTRCGFEPSFAAFRQAVLNESSHPQAAVASLPG